MPLDRQTHYELMQYFIDELDFKRMLDLDATVTKTFRTYLELQIWTAQCLDDIGLGDTNFLIEYARMLSKKPLLGVDMESCAEIRHTHFYYNAQKEICLTMPR